MSKNLPEDFDLDNILENLRKNVEKNHKEKQKEKKTEKNPEYIKSEENNINHEKKLRNEIFGNGVPDYYRVIGASSSDSQEIINKKCNQKLAEFHQDKIKNKLKNLSPDEAKKMKKLYEDQYDIVRTARSNLSDPEKRKYYDLQRKTADSSMFVSKKDSFQKFIDLQDSQVTEESKKTAELEFEKLSAEKSKKAGMVSNIGSGALEKKDLDRRIMDAKTQRDQEEIEYMPKKIKGFEHGGFNNEEFQRQWELQQKKLEKKKKKKDGDRSIIQWDGIAAFNDHGTSGGSYMSIEGDDAYEGLYKTSKEEDFIFADKIGSDDEESLSSIDSDIMDDVDVSYVKGFDKNKNKTMKSYEELLKERDGDTALFDNRTVSSKSWKSTIDNPFSISHQLGEIIGGDDVIDKKPKSSKKDMYDAYKALMQERDHK
jgi:hypothetical protein